MMRAMVIAVIGSVLVRYGRLNSLLIITPSTPPGLQRVELGAGPVDHRGDPAGGVVAGISGQCAEVEHGDDGLSYSEDLVEQVVVTDMPFLLTTKLIGSGRLIHVGAAVDGQCLTGDEARVFGEQEGHHTGDIVGLFQPPQRGVSSIIIVRTPSGVDPRSSAPTPVPLSAWVSRRSRDTRSSP